MGFTKSFAFLAALALAACNPAEVLDDTTAEIQQFHKALNEDDLTTIWRSTDPEFREKVGRERLTIMLTDFAEIFGTLKSTKRESVNFGSGISGMTATITTRSQYENGEVLETFVYRQHDERMLLISYDAQTPLLNDYDWSKLEGEGLILGEAPAS